MTTTQKVLLAGIALSLLGAGFGNGPVTAVGAVLVVAGIVMLVSRYL